MGRWTQYDEDDYRLPEGMKRVGYDADTQRYTFQKGDKLWLGEPGTEYGGTLTRAGTASGHVDDDDELEGGSPPGGRPDGYQPLAPDHDMRPVHSNHMAYRMFLPFMLLIGVFLLVVWRFIVGYAPSQAEARHCSTANLTYHVKEGDSCWNIAQAHKTTVGALRNQTLNPGLECERLQPGDVLCLPLPIETDVRSLGSSLV